MTYLRDSLSPVLVLTNTQAVPAVTDARVLAAVKTIHTHADAAGVLCVAGSDGCCTGCGVEMSTCHVCGGIGYHKAGCAESDDIAFPEVY